MKSYLLEGWLERWGLSPAQGAKVLRVNKSKISEWLSESNDRKLPDYIASHIETFDLLTESKGKKVIAIRLK
jgi:hypothetical protein|tara:strand:- start:81578 stop:81793 length:216 start_codon:yes stop_codon:yes gene_type:complete